MKQILQNLKSGNTEAAEVACPEVRRGMMLVQSCRSLISAGTERMLVDFSKGNLLQKARSQPDKVKQVLDKIKTDGLLPTIEAVFSKLDEPLPMGYCNVGRVLAVGDGVQGFQVGDRVASNGNHAEVVLVPKHLAARIPDEVTDDQAAFTVLGAIGLQGIRLIQPTLGETVAVFGLGLIGLLSVQILRAHGARVIGFDFDARRVELARSFGAQAENLSQGVDPVAAALADTRQAGVDGVLVTAATKSDELMHQAAQMCRKRGRIVLTGVTGLNLQRADFYEKELTFQVSCSYGPGRYDPAYEQQGHDYPLGFVRWTEQRNFEAVLDLMRDGRLETAPLVSRRVPFAEAGSAYELLDDRSVIGVLLTYPGAEDSPSRERLLAPVVCHNPARHESNAAVCGVIGAGGFAMQKIFPGLVKAGARLKWVASSKGLSGSIAARKFGIEQSTTESKRVLEDPEVRGVVIATRHNTHAELVVRALEAGKSVFAEKPMCLTSDELARIEDAYRLACQTNSSQPVLMVGYNRRFAPLVQSLVERLRGRQQPLSMIYTVNAGAIPGSHWTQDPAVGGGRILGEACHFIDLLHFLAGESPITQVSALRHGSDEPSNRNDTVAISLRMADGSLGQINYFANGPKSFPKERLEVFSEGRVLRLDNFRRLEGFGCMVRKQRSWLQDKGHNAGFRAWVEAVRTGGESPIPLASLVNTTRAALAVGDAIRQRRVVELATDLAAAERRAA
ncbi:MAG: bi-domain-containing oxidoreductase [Pirellulaceae bacterium]|nr:bi-domain-containing oxidoreductase [Pirellulaceae bacterium]